MTDIARLSVRLEDVEPAVVRQIEVPLGIRLSDLHLVLQIAMGWENYHLYEFRIGRSLAWGIPDPSWPDQPTLSAKKSTLTDLLSHLKRTKSFQYLYDFGDDWLHTLTVEAIIPAADGADYPRLLAAQGACPPEDCGGPWGYANYIAAIADPDHEQHEDMIEWGGRDFDPSTVNEAAIRKELTKYINRRRRKPKPTP